MEFGPEIKLENAKKPEWLEAYTPCQAHSLVSDKWYMDGDSRRVRICYDWDFSVIDAICLPASHPRYNLITHTYTVRPEDEAALLASDPLSRSTPDERAVAPELVARLVELAERLAKQSMGPWPCQDEARAIVAALEPVNGDLVEARKVACESSRWTPGGVEWLNAEEGRADHIPMVKCAIAALARGRQLEKEGK